jgi:GntR family transcriptional repressor for pyruvate dehydrogenase complex
MSDASILVGRLTPPANLTSELVRRLAAEIEGGKLAPGARLPTEHEIMASTGVSRTVVREAIAALRAQGLVVTRQGAGVFVAPDAQRRPFRIDPAEIDSLGEILRLMELRISVEAEAAGLAAERRSAGQLAEIGQRLKALDAAIARGGLAVEADFDFHKAIFAATDNPYFLRFLEFLGHFIIPRQSVRAEFGTAEERSTHLRRIRDEHVAIYDAIAAREPGRARDAARRHLVGSIERYRKLAATLDDGGPESGAPGRISPPRPPRRPIP